MHRPHWICTIPLCIPIFLLSCHKQHAIGSHADRMVPYHYGGTKRQWRLVGQQNRTCQELQMTPPYSMLLPHPHAHSPCRTPPSSLPILPPLPLPSPLSPAQDKLEHVARKVRACELPFGGLQVIASGDFFQLPPVHREAKQTRIPCLEGDGRTGGHAPGDEDGSTHGRGAPASGAGRQLEQWRGEEEQWRGEQEGWRAGAAAGASGVDRHSGWHAHGRVDDGRGYGRRRGARYFDGEVRGSSEYGGPMEGVETEGSEGGSGSDGGGGVLGLHMGGTQTQAHTPTQTRTQSPSHYQSQSLSQYQPQSQSQYQPESQSQYQHQYQPQSQSQYQPESQSQYQSQPQSQSQSASQPWFPPQFASLRVTQQSAVTRDAPLASGTPHGGGRGGGRGGGGPWPPHMVEVTVTESQQSSVTHPHAHDDSAAGHHNHHHQQQWQ